MTRNPRIELRGHGLVTTGERNQAGLRNGPRSPDDHRARRPPRPVLLQRVGQRVGRPDQRVGVDWLAAGEGRAKRFGLHHEQAGLPG